MLIFVSENIPYVDKVSWSDNKYPFIRKVYDFSLLIYSFQWLVAINIGIKASLEIKVTLNVLIEGVVGRHFEGIRKNVGFIIFGLWNFDLEIIVCRRINGTSLVRNIKNTIKFTELSTKNFIIRILLTNVLRIVNLCNLMPLFNLLWFIFLRNLWSLYDRVLIQLIFLCAFDWLVIWNWLLFIFRPAGLSLCRILWFLLIKVRQFDSCVYAL